MDEIKPTLVEPPPIDPTKSVIENGLELTELAAIGPDVFTNTRPLYHPPGARGIFGGAVIAQCLAAGQRTVPSDFTVHSMHCYFVLAGDSTIPVLYHVERVRSGRSFATRTVQARQKGRAIFTTTMSFSREGSGGVQQLRHAVTLPDGVAETKPPDHEYGDPVDSDERGGRPFEYRAMQIYNARSKFPHEKRNRQWIRAQGRICGGHEQHLEALAYMSDSGFIGTVSRVHNIWKYASHPIRTASDKSPSQDEIRGHLQKLKEFNDLEDDLESLENKPEIGMMVSLDHIIYFHEPRRFRADEWMFTDMQTPWAGEGRGLAIQHIWTADGVLVATCIQEGVVRLTQDIEKAKL